ncbi:uncharacterized protein ACHE_10234A [Aspergillus chevalieri]|uniref:Uncharacterized protein n=1 Tax=Aspergillus chevalieri TaxID=182096 RepID=A0A7R7ZJB1_ASPCH|nr:uncharacterized protein ACHE_10234A [Aspergillus chevalieri]BCR82832.1 hypothetical protein ACHE_10234A [Aspergillus chevalieri]
MFCADDIPRNDTSNENDSTSLEAFNLHSKAPSWCAETKSDLKNHGKTLFENDVPGMAALRNGTLKYDASRHIKNGFRLSDGLERVWI